MGFNIGSALIMVGIVSCIVSVADAAEGIAVFYKLPYTPSKCNGNSNDRVIIAGVSDALWNGGAACGRKYRVLCVRGFHHGRKPFRDQADLVGVQIKWLVMERTSLFHRRCTPYVESI
ncbi:hypothetical protein NC653_039951 [Populus alba x Populus x berolinensis]|uniref:Uncharacterized protein n=1 Tax=Populus alba x Populus x berolinensis TaxID=444605 RepID=A0AAD6PR53_9ROSI|nr:hypothetical protein NC653_039951 [Populus alba x Populus x berolinensis]